MRVLCIVVLAGMLLAAFTLAPVTPVHAVPANDFSIALTNAGGTNFATNDSITYTVNVTNTPTSTTVTTGTSIDVTALLPVGLTITGLSGTSWTVNTTGYTTPAIVTASYIGTYPVVPGTTLPPITITGILSGVASYSYSVTASVAVPGDTNAANDTSTDTVNVTAPTPQTFIVTRAADDVNDANCTVGSCTLRQAVNASNLNNPGTGTNRFNTIVFAVDGTTTLANGTLTLTRNVAIDASSPLHTVTVDGGHTTGSTGVRVFAVSSSVQAAITGLTIQNGYVGAFTSGGGLLNNGLIQVFGCTFIANVALGGAGGAIANGTGGVMGITNSTFTRNSTTSASPAMPGTRSMAPTGGGAISNDGLELTIINSSIVGDPLTPGSSIRNASFLTLVGSLVIPGLVGSGTLQNNGGNLIDPPTPLLGPLGYYGGTTQTFPLLPNSPAIDGGASSCPTTIALGAPNPRGPGPGSLDQRGVGRPVQARCDNGAFESQYFTTSALTGNGQNAPITTAFPPVGLTVSDTNNEPVIGGQVIFTITPGGTGASATFAGGGTVVTGIIGTNGVVTTPAFTANSTLGGFTIVATARGILTPVTFTETNIALPVVTHFSVSGFPASVRTGTSGTVTVTALDATNAIVTFYTGTVHLTSSDLVALLGPNATLTNGVGTFTVTLTTVGIQSITATDTVTSSITGAQTGITVTAPPPPPPTPLTVTAPIGSNSGNNGTAVNPSLRPGASLTLLMANALADSTFTFTSSDPGKVFVDANGLITGLSLTTTPVTITVTSSDGQTATILVVVSPLTTTGLEAPAPQPAVKAGNVTAPGVPVAPQPVRKADGASLPPASGASGVQPQAAGAATAIPQAQPARR